jgi:MFS family permease
MAMARNIRLLSIFNFFLNFEPHMPVAIIYFSHVTGSFALGMTVFSVAMVSSALFEIPTGVISDLIGRKKTMMLGGIAGTVSILCYALAGSFWMLALGSVFEGLMGALYSGNNNAFLHDTLKQAGQEEKYSYYLGRTSSLFQVGLGVSAILGGLVSQYSLPLVMWIGILPRSMCIFISMFMIEPTVHAETIETNAFAHLKEALRQFRQNAKLRKLNAAYVIDYGIGQASFLFKPAFYQTLWPLWALGFGRALANVAGFISYWSSGTVVKRFGAFKALIGSKLGTHSVTLFAVAIPTVLSPILIALTSLFYGVKTVSEQTLLHREFTDKQRATMGSLNQFASSIFFGLFAYLFGMMADLYDARLALILGEIALFAVILLYARVFMHDRRGNTATPTA